MFEIRGKINTAVCFATVVEEEAIGQIRRMCDYEMTAGSRIRIMPDVHAGAGCTIGTTMTIIDKAVPNVVGVDIGCGMYTVKLLEKEMDYVKMDEACHIIPSGRNVWEGRQERFDLEALRCYRELKDTKRLVRSLGTLGEAITSLKWTERQSGRRDKVSGDPFRQPEPGQAGGGDLSASGGGSGPGLRRLSGKEGRDHPHL